MASSESNNSNKIEANGIHMEILEPNFIVLPIPDKITGINTSLQINVTITNNILELFPFIYDLLIPELLVPGGQVLHPQKLINRQATPNQYNGMGIPHKKTLSCYLIAKISWHNNLLKLQAAISNSSQVSIVPDYLWSFEALQLGTYQLRFTYLSPEREFLFFDARNMEISQVQTSITNLLATSWVNLQLIKPVESNKNGVQVDGIRFETVVPQKRWNISCSELSDSSSPIQIGINITNNTSIEKRFCSFNTLMPTLMGADGFILGRNLGGGSTGWSQS